jgi:hypothetical protein
MREKGPQGRSASSMYVSNCLTVYGENVGVDTTMTYFLSAAKYVMVTTPVEFGQV